MVSQSSGCDECGNPTKKNNRFCGKSCAATYGNRSRKLKKTCTVCDKEFTTKAGNAKYCSDECADQTDNSNGYRAGHGTKKKWKRLKRKIDRGVCYRCGWDKTICDLAHVEARKNGGSSDPRNLTVLCPNCHRLADKTDKIDIEEMPTVHEWNGGVD